MRNNIKVKANTKKGQNLLAIAKQYQGLTLDDIYSKASPEKSFVWRDCFYKCAAENGKNFHICSHNAFNFSVAWEVENGYRMVTAKNNYFIVNQ